jgi:DivIVA domain-containing protein
MATDPSLTPDLVSGQSFTTAFRGYDPGEVRSFLARLAAELQAWRQRAEEFESAWHSAEERAARPPVLDEDTLMAAVGDETASILRTARAAAADLRTKAAEEAERVLAEARSAAESLRAEAEQAVASASAAASEQADRTLAAARQEAAGIVGAARQEADAIRSAAEKDRRLTIEGANTTRDRILEDLARRRRVAAVQIEQLRAGRERLVETYAVVRRTLEEVTAELSRADAEARAAADEVGRRMNEAPEPTEVGPEAQAAGEEAAPQASAVDELFARIKSTRPEATAGGGHAEAVEGPEGSGDDPETLLQARDSLVNDLETALTRRLKRALQDEQNDVLDRMRHLKGEVGAEAVLADPGGQAGRYADAARALLERAAEAGAGFAGRFTGCPAPDGPPAGTDDLAAQLADQIAGPLRRRLEQAVEAGAGDQAALAESLGAAYREWKAARIERIAGDALCAAFSRGIWEAAPEGGRLRWVVDDLDGACPDCDDDALAGELTKPEPFPTGQNHPPAHSGCRCLLVPVKG